MSKGLEALKEYRNQQTGVNVHADDYLDIIEEELKQAEENEKWLNVFKNALTIERQIPPELEIKESENGNTYVFREAVKIHENRIEEMLKKSLREWVLKNAFPKELEVLDIIKRHPFILERLFDESGMHGDYVHDYWWGVVTDKEVEMIKEWLKNE